ncbi:GNAT family N-acetyltransferase [Sphingomonas sp. 32-62-10]|nr:MAG: AAC(3)-I family aminoglycoside 3-N-acetyltransferase [Sphingomonas sp. 12-62-6]OYX38135.1 MAG: AAC(3)-I family aminoglycoside 3-N-acetyltransferase [Sphingomonas sp. 32-62-10]
MTVRQLGSGDRALLRQLMDVFGDAFEDRVTYGEVPPTDAYLEKLLARDSFIALVALHGGAVVGGITAYDLPKPEQERSEIYLYDLAVAESHRRQGIATALIAALQRIAAKRGAWVVFVQADHGDDPAIALYTKLGAREDVLHFDIAPMPGTLAHDG